MNKSLQFIINTIKKGRCGESFVAENFEKDGFCYNFEDYLINLYPEINGTKTSPHVYKTCLTSDDKEMNVTIVYNPDADFEYFSSDVCIHDGTLLFLFESIEDLIYKVLEAETYNASTAPTAFVNNPWAYDVEYTVGDFVINTQYDSKFAPADKPWMMEKQIVCLPIAIKYIEKKYGEVK